MKKFFDNLIFFNLPDGKSTLIIEKLFHLSPPRLRKFLYTPKSLRIFIITRGGGEEVNTTQQIVSITIYSRDSYKRINYI